VSATSQHRIRVLQVDDESDFADLTKTFLEREDDRFAVETATDAGEGLQYISDRPPDCVVSDYNMPGMDGIEFLEAVREECPDLPFILFTGRGSEEVASEAISAGVTDYLQKGSGTSQYTVLANRISNVVKAARSASEAEQRRYRLEQILKTVPGCVVQLNTDGQFVFANERAEAVLGLETDELTDRTYNDAEWELQKPNGAPIPDEQLPFRQVCDAAEPIYDARHTITWPDGSEKILSVNAAPLFDETGSVESVVASLSDITDRRERQRELQLLQQAFDDANVPITLADPSDEENPLVYVNDAFERVTGYPPEKALGRNCRFLQGDGTDPEKITALRDAIDSQEPITVELRNYRKDGTEFWNRLTVTPIYDDRGQLVRYLGTQEDITERKEREQKLNAERRSIERALDTLDELFYVLDTDGSLRRWNDQVPETTGYTDRDLAEIHAAELFHNDDRETIHTAIETTLAEGRATVEADLLTPDGERRPYEFTGTQLNDGDGNVTGLVGIGRDLTDRRRRERRFEALVEKSDDIISIVGTDGVFQYQSPSVERILGYDPEETIGDTAWEYIHPDDRAKVIESFERAVVDPDANPVVEYRSRHADGSWRWLEAHGNNQLDNPAIEGYIINSRDVTDRKARERRLEQTQDMMSNMEQLAGVGAWEYDPESDTLTLTEGVRRIHGLESGVDLTVEAAFDTFHPDDRDLLEHRFNACVETGEPYEMDVRLTTSDGAQRWITTRGERVTNGGSGAVVRGYIQDITEQKQRETELRNLKSQYETLAENFPGGAVFLINAELECVRAGGRELSNVGLSPDDIEGTKPHARYPEELADELCHHYEKALDGSANTFEQEYEGERYQVQTVPVRTGDEDINHVMSVSQNITEDAEDRRRLKRQNKRLAEFSSIVSHDLRNPLTVAAGHLELVQDSSEGEHIRKASNAIERCQTLIDDLLTLAREGDQVSETDAVVLANVAEECWETVETAAASLSVEAPRTIEADRSRLRQLLENLYRNAVEHGGDDVTVSVGVMADGFAVADTGPGIPESDREEIFRAGHSTSKDGTGFGLRIVKQVANAHGWEVTVTKSEQGGARFEFTGVRLLE
jgi:PAS domain S-box-containing protein